jgi:glycosyltransferase involved in cell wall biosynthesis
MLWLPKLFGIPVVATVHGLDWQRAKWSRFASAMILKGERTAVKHADEIIVLSENVREYFRSTYGRRTHYIPNGIDTPVPAAPAEIQSLYGLSGDDYFLFVARIVPEKGLHYLIRAFRETDTKLKLIIAGANGGSQEYADQVRSLSGGDDRICFTGFVKGTALAEIYTNCRAFVLPSDVEGMSVSLLEAMSFGALCVVSDIPENLEVVGDRAVSFPKGDVKALGEILKKISDDPGFAAGRRKGVSEYITSRYSWDKAADETLKLYRKVAKPGRREVPASGDSDENSDDQ